MLLLHNAQYAMQMSLKIHRHSNTQNVGKIHKLSNTQRKPYISRVRMLRVPEWYEMASSYMYSRRGCWTKAGRHAPILAPIGIAFLPRIISPLCWLLGFKNVSKVGEPHPMRITDYGTENKTLWLIARSRVPASCSSVNGHWPFSNQLRTPLQNQAITPAELALKVV